MDEHIPRAITIGLRLKGVDVLTVQDDNLSGEADVELIKRATYLKRVIVTHDSDLLIEVAKNQKTGRVFYGVIYAHPLRVSISTCIRDIELLAKYGEIEEIRNQVIFLPLKY